MQGLLERGLVKRSSLEGTEHEADRTVISWAKPSKRFTLAPVSLYREPLQRGVRVHAKWERATLAPHELVEAQPVMCSNFLFLEGAVLRHGGARRACRIRQIGSPLRP